MAKFLVRYSSGVETETESSDCATVEAFCNTHFGSTWAEASANGAKVELVEEQTDPGEQTDPTI